MQTLNYWKQFENTGKIEDYLSYKRSCDTAYGGTLADRGEGAGGNEISGRQGAMPYAGIHMCNRNDIEADSYR